MLTHIFFLKDLWNVLSLVFNGIIIRHLSFPWHIGNVFLFFVLYHCSLIRHVLDSRFPFNGCLGHCCNWRNRCDHRLNWDRCHQWLSNNRLGSNELLHWSSHKWLSGHRSGDVSRACRVNGRNERLSHRRRNEWCTLPWVSSKSSNRREWWPYRLRKALRL